MRRALPERGTSMQQYLAYELAHMMIQPMRIAAKMVKQQAELPFNPFAKTPMMRQLAAACEVFEGVTRRYGKPDWGITSTRIHGLEVPVREETVMSKPFCNLVHFDRAEEVVLLVDSSKFASSSGAIVCALDEIDVLITDAGIAPGDADMIRKAGVRLVVAR